MFSAFANVFRVPDLKKKVFFTLGILIVYRLGAFIPTPGIDGGNLAIFFARLAETQGGTIFGIMNMFSGGAVQRLTRNSNSSSDSKGIRRFIGQFR